jgi:hypothetical protein
MLMTLAPRIIKRKEGFLLGALAHLQQNKMALIITGPEKIKTLSFIRMVAAPMAETISRIILDRSQEDNRGLSYAMKTIPEGRMCLRNLRTK